ncbi:hypothetical protein XA68_10425 [Ophiocordyceps unilateralis]|uniref:Zinc finger H2C2-type histone UAS binding domain-containing protein n=1 Tax=Ophiocordyceps unilateralis TaxID=268505 RepID=A0A2A9PQU4_OPHUN|nr:hypothetical protein XA68_10425 [Ophiocordyceps unilateralis]
MEDPAGPTMLHVSGQPPFPDPSQHTELPPDLGPRQVTLRDRQTAATIVPVASRQQVPDSLVAYLCDQLNREIEGGDTYPMTERLSADSFADYWFRGGFAAVMLLGTVSDVSGAGGGGGGDGSADWSRECLGSFFIQANYPGRSSHVCTGSFIVTDGSRNRGVGRLMGETYLEWAPRLGYRYSVFNLVYETNVASCRIWDALGFKRIGRVKACGKLRSYPDRLIDAIIYGRDLLDEGAAAAANDDVGEDRFDKIRFYLKYGKYPNGAGRAEKSRLRSAATHYKLLEGDRLMLRDKEVVADPARQYEVARQVHALHHGGINKTTASIAEKYHWSRIKETVSDVIRACVECKDPGKPAAATERRGLASAPAPLSEGHVVVAAQPDVLVLQQQANQYPDPGDMSVLAAASQQPCPPAAAAPSPPPPPPLPQLAQPHTSSSPQPVTPPPTQETQDSQHQDPMLQDEPASQRHLHHHHHYHHHHHHHHPLHPDPSSATPSSPSVLPPSSPSHHHHHLFHHHHHHQPIDPQMINDAHLHHDPHAAAADNPFDHYSPHPDFQALLDDDDDAVDRDLEMLIDHDPVDDHDAAALDRHLSSS